MNFYLLFSDFDYNINRMNKYSNKYEYKRWYYENKQKFYVISFMLDFKYN